MVVPFSIKEHLLKIMGLDAFEFPTKIKANLILAFDPNIIILLTIIAVQIMK